MSSPARRFPIPVMQVREALIAMVRLSEIDASGSASMAIPAGVTGEFGCGAEIDGSSEFSREGITNLLP